MAKREIHIGSYYRHFKGNLYQVDGFAKHTERNELLVLYHRVLDEGFDTTLTYARPFNLFVALVDKKKYPNANQEFRFEEEFYDFC